MGISRMNEFYSILHGPSASTNSSVKTAGSRPLSSSRAPSTKFAQSCSVLDESITEMKELLDESAFSFSRAIWGWMGREGARVCVVCV